jgi:hypothetical protein
MKTIHSVVDYELLWSQQTVFKNEYELRWGGELVATFRFPKMLSTMGAAESGDGRWTFERIGFWKAKTIVKAQGSEDVLGSFTDNTWKAGGVLQLPGGKRYLMRRNIWRGTSEFQTDEGEPLFQLQNRGSFRVSTSVRIQRRALQIPELPWMVLLGFYLGIMARREAATHAAVGS